MKTDDIPQDNNRALAGVRKRIYAVDADGRYTSASTSGWHVEEVVTDQAVAEYQRLADDALARARKGVASPLEFHMCDRRLDVPTLAAATGLWQWQVRRHLQPQHFKNVSDAVLDRYADALGISAAAIRSLPGSAE